MNKSSTKKFTDDSFADRLRQRLERKLGPGFTNREAADYLGDRAANTVGHWLKGEKTPHWRTIQELARILDCSPEWLSARMGGGVAPGERESSKEEDSGSRTEDSPVNPETLLSPEGDATFWSVFPVEKLEDNHAVLSNALRKIRDPALRAEVLQKLGEIQHELLVKSTVERTR